MEKSPLVSCRRSLQDQCGDRIGIGGSGEVYEDATDPAFVLKKYAAYSDDDGAVLREAKEESRLFNRYYGEQSSEVIEEDGAIYLRMLKIPGTPLNQLERGTLSLDQIRALYFDMIVNLNEVKIIHGDLHAGNIVYDESSHQFFPIDFVNVYDAFYSAKPAVKEKIDMHLAATMKEYINGTLFNW
ncbi:serine/threonine-protein kinase [Herbaspirillum sp. RTI4]|uniref:serine/threonine-protein kinase n=1 Tax=Herbaspirillum sp. RTI4 TaxID=3048640 RepID=UPI002AB5D9E4|nr:serine/threonine-protein kinase [Herbaspirillum sp. RTI4]MDY7579626.1 serine/threonine-protein kinase [Herbaspirillum sp. RTI4]